MSCDVGEVTESLRAGKLQNLFIPSKTATLVSSFAVEDLPSAELQTGSCACSEEPAFGQNTLMMMMVMMMMMMN